ncbi:hypothetical protein UlMin_009655 [Ulmus minor]
MSSSKEFGFGAVQDKLSSSDKDFQSLEEVNAGFEVHFYGKEGWGDSRAIDFHFPDFEFYEDDSLAKQVLFSKYREQEHQQQRFSEYGLLGEQETQFEAFSPPLEACLTEIAKLGELSSVNQDVEAKKDKEYLFSLASLELLNNYGNGVRRLMGERVIEPSNVDDSSFAEVVDRKFSTEEILRIAGARFVQSSSQENDVQSMLSHPFEYSFTRLSNEETKDVELVELLLASTEKVGYQQFERASKLLKQCYESCSKTGNPVQRVVYYFCEALKEKIDRATGRITSKSLGTQDSFDPNKALMSMNATHLAFHQAVPFSQLSIFPGIQTILENVSKAKKVHVIDLGMRNGIQWIVLMQALASCHNSLELLKITAIGTTLKHEIDQTGKRLLGFAQSMNIPFSFKIVMVSNMLELKQDLFERDADEKVVIYASYLLRSMLSQPDQLDTLMLVMRNLNPCVMVVTEVEGNHNSPVFMTRFIEALFFYGAFFDCVEAFMKRDDQHRMITESLYFGQGIRNMVVAEGGERKIRHVKLDVWRAFFARFRMEEAEFSPSSLYQAKLVIKRFSCGDSCTIDMNGKCLMFGWKGTPIQSLSAWKFL